MEKNLLVLALALILTQCYQAAPYVPRSYIPRGNYGGYGNEVESKGYGGSKSYGYDDGDDEDGSLYGMKPSYSGRSYGGKSYGDNGVIIEEIRIVEDIVVKKVPIKSYDYGIDMGSYGHGQNRYVRDEKSINF
jgi:hypothetical protein